MPILLTGASGFVGSAVLRRLLAAGHAVRALVRPSSDRRNLAGLDVEVVEGDLMDRASLDRAARGCGALFHVAADYRLWARDPKSIVIHNVMGTQNIMRAAQDADVGRIVYTSSVAVLGLHRDGRPADEETPVMITDMIGPYKLSKFLAEALVRGLTAERDLPAIIVNPSTPVGPRDVKPTPTGRMIVEAARGRMPAYVDTGLNLAHVDDVAEGHLLAFERGEIGQRYILGGENIELRDILRIVAELSGRRPPTVALPHDLVMPIAWAAEAWTRLTGSDREPFATVDGIKMARKKMFFSSAKAQRDLGYHARPARQGLAEAVAWFADNGYLR